MNIRDNRPPEHQVRKKSFSTAFVPPSLDKYEMAHPGLSGPGGMVLGSAPCHEANLLNPDEINSVRFSFLKIWTTASTRHTVPYTEEDEFPEDIDLFVRFRPDPSGALELGGNPLANTPEYMSIFVAEKDMTEVPRTWTVDPITQEEVEDTQMPDVTEYQVMYIVTNHPEDPTTDSRSLYEQHLPNGSDCPVTICMMCGEPTERIKGVVLTQLFFGVPVPAPPENPLPEGEDPEDAKAKSFATISSEFGDSEILVEATGMDEETDPPVPLGYAQIKFTVPKEYFTANPEHAWKCHFIIKIGDRSATLPEIIYVGPDKSIFYEHPGGDRDHDPGDFDEPGPPIPTDPDPGYLSWNPYTIYHPLVIGGRMNIDEGFITIGNSPPEVDTSTPDNKYGG